MMSVKSLTPGGCWPKELRRSSQYIVYWKICANVEKSPNEYGTKEDVTVTGRLVARRWLKARFAWHFGGVGTQESGESTWSGRGGDVESEDLRVCCEEVTDRSPQRLCAFGYL